MKKKKEKKGIKVKIPRVNPWAISTLILLIILAMFLIVGPGTTGGVTSVNEEVTAQEAANKAVDWISNYYKAGGVDVKVTLVNASETENGIYQFTIKLSSVQGEVEQTHYVTRDGKLLFASAIDLTETLETPETPEQQTPETPEVQKSDKPEVHAFVMSYCPYGLQFMKAYVPVIELLGNKADLELNFVHYIMHGEKEMTENTRMYCIQKEQKDKFSDYLRCFVESDDPEKCMADVGIDKAQVETCMQEIDEEFEITKTFEESEERFPPYNVDAELSQKYGVRGSPTFVINGQTISVTRSADAIKEAVCGAFNTPPEECETELSTTAEQPGIGALGSGSGASASGQC